ncbi:MAG: transketolase family protein, partial [Ruminococcus sp.]|nr:transketolase family protein [Ruminococcus sp.]
TVEEHSIIGGLGSAVCDVVSEKCPVPVTKIGVNDVFGHSGPAVDLLKQYGLCADNIVKTALSIVK